MNGDPCANMLSFPCYAGTSFYGPWLLQAPIIEQPYACETEVKRWSLGPYWQSFGGFSEQKILSTTSWRIPCVNIHIKS